MKDPAWSDLYDGIYAMSSDELNSVPKPTDADIDHSEEVLHLKLPRSYRSFIKLFGPGGFVYQGTEQCSILSPSCVGNSRFDIIIFNERFRKSLRGSPSSKSYYKDPELIHRLVFFGQTVGNDYYGWDPEGASNQAAFEMPVHQLLRLNQETSIVAGNFISFIEHYCVHESLAKHSTSPKKHCVFFPAQITPSGRKKLAKVLQPAPEGTIKSKVNKRPKK